jgi:hypothetical protein
MSLEEFKTNNIAKNNLGKYATIAVGLATTALTYITSKAEALQTIPLADGTSHIVANLPGEDCKTLEDYVKRNNLQVKQGVTCYRNRDHLWAIDVITPKPTQPVIGGNTNNNVLVPNLSQQQTQTATNTATNTASAVGGTVNNNYNPDYNPNAAFNNNVYAPEIPKDTTSKQIIVTNQLPTVIFPNNNNLAQAWQAINSQQNQGNLLCSGNGVGRGSENITITGGVSNSPNAFVAGNYGQTAGVDSWNVQGGINFPLNGDRLNVNISRNTTELCTVNQRGVNLEISNDSNSESGAAAAAWINAEKAKNEEKGRRIQYRIRQLN